MNLKEVVAEFGMSNLKIKQISAFMKDEMEFFSSSQT